MTRRFSPNFYTIFLSVKALLLAPADYSAVPAPVCDMSRQLTELLSTGVKAGRASGIIA